MDFEQMQIIWDEQKGQRLYALDLSAMHAIVRQRGRRIARGVDLMEIGLILISIVMVAVFATKSVLEPDQPHQYVSAAVLAGVSIYLIVERLRRRAHDRKFEANLRGDLDLAIAQVDYHIRRIRTFPVWFYGPLFVTILVNFISKYDGHPSWLWLLVLISFPFGIYVTRLELRCLLPRKRELEALRAKLSSDS